MHLFMYAGNVTPFWLKLKDCANIMVGRIMKKDQYKTPVVLWASYWKQNGTEVKATKTGEEYRVPTYALYGVPNKEHKSYKEST